MRTHLSNHCNYSDTGGYFIVYVHYIYPWGIFMVRVWAFKRANFSDHRQGHYAYIGDNNIDNEN